MCLFELFKIINNNNSNDLSPWEQEEVNKGNYDKSNFEEEDPDEDDFYSDDLD